MFSFWVGKAGGAGFPSSLTALYGAVKGDLATAVDWSAGAAMVVKFRPTMASDAVIGDIQIIGPLYIRAGYLVAKDGTNEAVYATSWAAGETINAIVETHITGLLRVGRIM